jgi:hypothetical protein
MPLRPLPPPAPDLGRALPGVWKLRSREDHDEAGTRHIDPILGADPIGMLCFGPRHFSAQFSRRDRSAAAPATAATPGKNNSGAVNGYDAYFGTWTLDPAAGTITITLEGSVNPASVGQTFTRDTRVVGDELIIRLATTAADGTAVTRTLTFDRVG